ncbi:MAG TPA: ABC transporter permease [Chloroflexia bacterium]|nr:ABC transporter permease [Chloroflexia bacterium]
MAHNRGARLFVQAAAARAYPRIWGANREMSWVFFEILVPLLNTAAFVFLYRALGAPDAYVGFVILGATMATYWVNVLWMMASQLYWDKQGGFLELYIMAPVSMVAILLGMAVGGLYRASLRAATIAIAGTILFSVQLDGRQWGLATVVFFVAMFALYGLGMLLSSLFLMWGRVAWQLSMALSEPVFFLTGLNFPLSKLFNVAGLVSIVSAVIPVSFGLDALRQLLFPGQITGVLPPLTELGILLVLGVVFTTAAYFMLRRMEWLARVEARLSLRSQ